MIPCFFSISSNYIFFVFIVLIERPLVVEIAHLGLKKYKWTTMNFYFFLLSVGANQQGIFLCKFNKTYPGTECFVCVSLSGGSEKPRYQRNENLDRKISLYSGDITRLEIDAIVNAGMWLSVNIECMCRLAQHAPQLLIFTHKIIMIKITEKPFILLYFLHCNQSDQQEKKKHLQSTIVKKTAEQWEIWERIMD